MNTAVCSKIAVIGCGISGAVCASNLAKNGVAVTIFESGRGPGGLLIWAVTLAGLLGGGALLVYNTSALGS